MEENKALIERLYAGLDGRDGAAMTACYAPDATFEDPAFGELHGPDIGAMWRMLTSRATDLSVELRSHEASDTGGRANWVATYTFAATGNRVVNDVHATYLFSGGLIVDHRDDFDFRTWARQALGGKGVLVAIFPPFRARARKQALDQLKAFKKSEGRSGK